MPLIRIFPEMVFGCLIYCAVGVVQAQEILDAILDMFDESCAFPGRHTGTRPAGGLNLTKEYDIRI